jgi:hypothetical protein
VRHIDEELEGEAEAVFNEARGDEDGLRGAEGGVAMADGAVAEFNRVGGRDEVLAGIGDGERNEVVGSAPRLAWRLSRRATTRFVRRWP